MRRPFDDETWALFDVPRRVESVRRALLLPRPHLLHRAHRARRAHRLRVRRLGARFLSLASVSSIALGLAVGIVCAFLLSRRAPARLFAT